MREQRETAAETGSTEKKTDPPTIDMDTAIPEEKYDFDLPDEADYIKGDDDEEGLTVFLADMERYDGLLPLKGGKYKDGVPAEKSEPAADIGSATAAKADSVKPAEDPPTSQAQADDEIKGMLDDLQEALEESDEEAGEHSNVSVDFFDQFRAVKFRLTPDMLEWLVENDEHAHALATEFVKRPRSANKIARAPESRRGALLKSLANKLADPGDGDGKGTERGGTRAAAVEPLRNPRRSANPVKSLVEASSYEEL